MEEIRVNEYVRTYDGIIAKLEYINELSDYFFDRTMYRKYSDTIEFLQEYELEKYIVKHSFNIAELIEPEDFVNDFKVSRKDGEVIVIKDYFGFNRGIEAQDIKSIVTKEQFESIKYEV